MYSYPWVLLALPSGCNQEFPYFPKISQYVSTLFPNTESYKDHVSLLSLVSDFFRTCTMKCRKALAMPGYWDQKELVKGIHSPKKETPRLFNLNLKKWGRTFLDSVVHFYYWVVVHFPCRPECITPFGY